MTMMVVENTSESVQSAMEGFQFLELMSMGRAVVPAGTDTLEAISWAQNALAESPEMGFLRDALIVTVPTAALMHIAKYGANAFVLMYTLTDAGVQGSILESDTI